MSLMSFWSGSLSKAWQLIQKKSREFDFVMFSEFYSLDAS